MKNTNKMKSKPLNIKTITCHNVYNYGASLQEYALLYYLKRLGHNAKAIKYNPDYLSGHFNFWAVSNPKYNENFVFRYAYLLAKLPSRILSLKRKYNFDKFSTKYINTTKTEYKSNDELKNDVPDADVYICGSDQIWNSFFQNGKDPAFYLDFAPEDKLKISYAASFATKTIEEAIKPFVKNKVNNIDIISVRESSGIAILKDLDINNVTHVLDPVFLLNKETWQKIATPVCISKPYILLYDADNNPSIKKYTLQIAKENNLKIISISPRINYADKNLSNKGPDIFLSLIKDATFVISNSFHAVAFSIIFKKQFVVFNRSEKINTRMQDFVNLFNISNTILAYNFQKKEKINITNYIDYNKVTPLLEYQIKKSKLFITNSLNQKL